MLTPAQVDHFHTFGFVVLRSYFTPAEVARLQDEAERELTHQYRHQPHDGTRRHYCCMNDDERVPTYARLLGDPRFIDVADQLLGEALPVWCDANRYSDPETGWHADLYPELPRALEQGGVKFCHYLEPLTTTTGALRVIPGSHRRPLHDQVRAYLDTRSSAVTSLPAVACETAPGDVVAFNIAIFHASSGGGRNRRLCTVAYHRYPGTDEEAAELRQQFTRHVPASRTGVDWHGEVFPNAWIARAATDPERRRVVERLHRMGAFAPLDSDAAVAAAALADLPLATARGG